MQSFSKLTLKQKPIHYSLLQGIQAFIQGIKMEPFIPCSKLAKPSFDKFSSKQLALTKTLNWQELDQIGHFAWGVGNKRCRASCVLDVSSDTYDTLRMICGDKGCFRSLFFLSFLSLKFYLKNNSSQFFCCRGSKLTLMGPLLSPWWMCLSFGKYANTSTG